ncbi:MAG: carboxymuconolactone decarboxylase family protein [Acidimicrobiales bacterium]
MTDEEKTQAGRDLARKLFSGAPGPRRPHRPRRPSPTTPTGTSSATCGSRATSASRSAELITCTILVALYRENEQRVHFVGAKNAGIPREKIEGMITHAAHYAGWPCAATAHRVLNEVWPAE